MKWFYLIPGLLISFALSGQRTIVPTDALHIIGKVTTDKIYSLPDLDQFPMVDIPDQVIYNQRGEIKDTLKHLHGVPLKTLLAPISLVYNKPKDLNGFYYVLEGADGYKVVLSWNEIYNTTLGDSFYIVTGMEGKKLENMEERILFISTGDLKAGRRLVKGLDRIEICRVE